MTLPDVKACCMGSALIYVLGLGVGDYKDLVIRIY
jgi:hypothetical protein